MVPPIAQMKIPKNFTEMFERNWTLQHGTLQLVIATHSSQLKDKSVDWCHCNWHNMTGFSSNSNYALHLSREKWDPVDELGRWRVDLWLQQIVAITFAIIGCLMPFHPSTHNSFSFLKLSYVVVIVNNNGQKHIRYDRDFWEISIEKMLRKIKK